jgi:hypothetical protein
VVVLTSRVRGMRPQQDSTNRGGFQRINMAQEVIKCLELTLNAPAPIITYGFEDIQ